MSILIKGMEMPKMPKSYNQGEVAPYIDIRIFADGKAITSKGEKPYFTEYCVIEVPTPHGRLIDAGALERDIEQYHLSDGKFQHWVQVQNTIIEAEEGEGE